MTNQAQFHTGQRVNVAGRSTVGTIITIGDEWNRPSCQGKLLICFGVEDGGNGYSFWYKVEKVTAITPAPAFDPDFANVGKAYHCPSCGTSSYDGACMYCGYVGDDSPAPQEQIETVTDDAERLPRVTCPFCSSDAVSYEGIDDGGDYGNALCDQYHCHSCDSDFEDCHGGSLGIEPLPPFEGEETFYPTSLDEIPFDHGYGGGGGYDKAIPTDAEQVRLDAAMNCLVRMPSSLLPREDQLLLIEIGGFLMARTEDNKARALAAVDRWFEAWAAELDQELPTIWDDQDTPILGMTPIYTAGGGGGSRPIRDGYEVPVCPSCQVQAAELVSSERVGKAKFVWRLRCQSCGYEWDHHQPSDVDDDPSGDAWWHGDDMRHGGGGDPYGHYRPRRNIRAVWVRNPHANDTEIAQDIQSLIEGGLLHPMVWGDPDQVTYVITPAGMDYLQMESGD